MFWDVVALKSFFLGICIMHVVSPPCELNYAVLSRV